MDNIKLGHKVSMAKLENIQFEVISQNLDGSYEIEAKIDQNKVLRYNHVSKEMLRPVME